MSESAGQRSKEDALEGVSQKSKEDAPRKVDEKGVTQVGLPVVGIWGNFRVHADVGRAGIQSACRDHAGSVAAGGRTGPQL